MKELREAIERHLVPLLAPLGMALVKNPTRPRPGITACTVARPLSGGRELVLQVWCDTPSRRGLAWRLDVRDGDLWGDLQLTQPFEREGFPPPRPMGGSHHELAELHPERSPADLDRAIAFLGPLLVASAPEIAQQVPELAPDLAAAGETPAWKAARESVPRRWTYRAVAGDLDPTEIEATFTFVGANLVILDAGGRRVSFKLPVDGIQKADRAFVSGWWITPAGTHAATVLRVGGRTWRFEPSGKLVV